MGAFAVPVWQIAHTWIILRQRLRSASNRSGRPAIFKDSVYIVKFSCSCLSFMCNHADSSVRSPSWLYGVPFMSMPVTAHWPFCTSYGWEARRRQQWIGVFVRFQYKPNQAMGCYKRLPWTRDNRFSDCIPPILWILMKAQLYQNSVEIIFRLMLSRKKEKLLRGFWCFYGAVMRTSSSQWYCTWLNGFSASVTLL